VNAGQQHNDETSYALVSPVGHRKRRYPIVIISLFKIMRVFVDIISLKDQLPVTSTLDDKTSSVTHGLMECSCNGEGEIPTNMKIEENQEDSRDCQFEIKVKNVKQQISINQLKSWQHFKNPIDD